ncbi:MAG: Uma2 family endonuclease [Vulcanimicrobiaceae bacterium]
MNQPQPEKISLADFLAWEQAQSERYEWIDGTVVRAAGGSYEHATIISNLNAIFHAALDGGPCFVQGSDRKLVPRDRRGHDLGSFYADLFVSCAPEDRRGDAAHSPTLVVEVLSAHVGQEFTRKRDAYLGSAALVEYFIVDSTRRYIVRYSWQPAHGDRGLFTTEYRRGPITVATLDLQIAFDQLYAGTTVAPVLQALGSDGEEDAEIFRD